MTIPTFPTPSKSVIDFIAVGQRLKAAREWQNEARSTLENGTIVAPTVALAVAVVKGLDNGLPPLNIAVEQGNYVDASQVDESVAMQKLKAERFAKYMEEDQVPETGAGVCDTCGKLGSVKNYYAPDGMGYPTLVLQSCIAGCE